MNQRVMRRLLTIEETAAMLQISVSQLSRMVARKTIPVIRIGKSVAFCEEQLAAWVQTQSETFQYVMTIEQVSDMTHISTKRLYQMVAGNRIPHKRDGRRIYFIRAQVLEWLNTDHTAEEPEETPAPASSGARPTAAFPAPEREGYEAIKPVVL